MKILLTSNTKQEIMVDDFNYDRLKHLTITACRNTLHVKVNNRFLGKTVGVALTKIILQTDKPKVDHIDRNFLNNLISNLRPCGHYEDMANVGITKRNSSGYKGVCFDKSRNKWMARLMINRKLFNLGRYETKEQAAIAYDLAVERYCKEFGFSNF